MKKLIFIALTLFTINAQAACRWVWVDHDYNTMTPPIQKQVCSNTYSTPTVRPPSVPPIQRPQIQPLPSFGVPPIGTTSCRTQSVFEHGRWVNKRICR